jgi:hypothetical protein
LKGPTTGSSSHSHASPTVTTDSVNGKKKIPRSTLRKAPRLSASASSNGTARIGSVLAAV